MVNKIGAGKYFAAELSVSSQTLTVCRHKATHLDCRGLTLVELVVVVGILGVLATMAIPSMQGYIRTAKLNACASDLRIIDKAVTAYYIDRNVLPASLNDVGLGNQLDPWKRNYIYTPLAVPTIPNDPAALKDSALKVMNTDYDLYSKGEDGLSNLDPTLDTTTADDVVRSNDGVFVGAR